MRGDRLIGQAFGRYHVEAQIGRGGMGVVYRARDTHLNRVIALKVLSDERASDGAFRERFLRESRLLASIDHPNIVPVYDAGETDGELYIAMRFLAGPELRTIIETEAPLDPVRAVGLIAQVADALDAAHAAGLVHRDVKPGNILVLPGGANGDVGHAYLTDFGLTKSADSDTGLTQVGQFIGTPGYVAPEQIEGKAVDHRADVYALGCILYNCLTGVVPYPRDSTVASLWAHLWEPPPKPTDRLADLPPALDAVIARGLAKAPADRFQTCGALALAAREAVRSLAADSPRRIAPAGMAPAAGTAPPTRIDDTPAPGVPPGAALGIAPIAASPTMLDLPAVGAAAAAATDPDATAPVVIPPPAGATVIDFPLRPLVGAASPTVLEPAVPVTPPPGAPPTRLDLPPLALPIQPVPPRPPAEWRRARGLTVAPPLAAVFIAALLAGGVIAGIGLLGGGRGGVGGATGSPSSTESAGPFAPDLVAYVIAAGETLESIAARHHVSVEDLLRLNPGISVDDFRPGVEIHVPPLTAEATGTPALEIASPGTSTPGIASPSTSVPTAAPATASAAPVDPTAAPPDNPTQPPENPTQAPANPTRAPANPTQSPKKTAAPVTAPPITAPPVTPPPATPPNPPPTPPNPPPANQAPLARNDRFETSDYPPDTNWYIFVMDNDSDPDGDSIRIYQRSQTTLGGSVEITTHAQRPGQTVVRYYAPEGVSGQWDYFDYWITDDQDENNSAGARVSVWVVQDLP